MQNHKKVELFILGFLFILLVQACGGRNNKTSKISNPADVQESLINSNKMLVKKESDEIDKYAETHHLKMKTTGTGLRYLIYKSGIIKQQATKGKYARVNYKISLLNGQECYSSEKSGSKEFLIGEDQIESGLHEAILLMNVSDKAIFILPSHLAHGMMGDGDKIPPRSSVVYEIELLSLK